MSLHETIVVPRLDGAQLAGHALLLRSHGERRDRGWRVILADVGVGSRSGSRVWVRDGGNRNTPAPDRLEIFADIDKFTNLSTSFERLCGDDPEYSAYFLPCS